MSSVMLQSICSQAYWRHRMQGITAQLSAAAAVICQPGLSSADGCVSGTFQDKVGLPATKRTYMRNVH